MGGEWNPHKWTDTEIECLRQCSDLSNARAGEVIGVMSYEVFKKRKELGLVTDVKREEEYQRSIGRITMKQVREMLCASEKTVRKHMRDGTLKSHEIEYYGKKKHFFEVRDVEKLKSELDNIK